MKTCEEYQELVSAYADGETTEEETAELFFHLGACRECRTFLTSVLRLDSLMKTAEPASRARAQVTLLTLWKRKFRVSFPVAAAAVALMLLSGSLYIVQKTQPPDVIHSTQTEYVYVTTLLPVDVVASPLPPKKIN